MVDMIFDIDPCYKKYVLTNKKTGKKKLYCKPTNVVYGTLLGSILFYQKLSDQLYEWGYEQNPYDPCIFNTMINCKQLTIQFYVNNLKCSYLEKYDLDNLVKELNNVFHTSKKEFAETKGNINKKLGLTIDFSGRYDANDPNKKG